MKNFIELNLEDRKIFVNVNHIILVQHFESGRNANDDKSCYVTVSSVSDKNSITYHIKETYEEVKELIKASI